MNQVVGEAIGIYVCTVCTVCATCVYCIPHVLCVMYVL